MYHEFTPYQSFHTYTFDNGNISPFKPRKNINTVNNFKLNRPIITDGIVKLYKEDIKVLYDKYDCNKKVLRVVHPQYLGKTGFIVFDFHDIPDSQDTKTIYSAYLILKDGVINCPAILKTCKTPWIMYMREDGYLNEYNGIVDASNFKKILDYKCSQ